MAITKVLIIGEVPTREMHDMGIEDVALLRQDLADLAGLSLMAWAERFDRINLFPTWQGKAGRGDAFPIWQARERAQDLVLSLHKHDKVVLLGRRVEAAFGLNQPWLEWRDVFGTTLAVAPHPSKLSRWWDIVENRANASFFWRQLAEETR